MEKKIDNLDGWTKSRIKFLEDEIKDLKGIHNTFPSTPDVKEQENPNDLSENHKLHYFLLDNMSQGIVYHNCRGEIIFANQAASDILGLTLDQLYGKTPYDKQWRATNSDGYEMKPEDYPSYITLKTGKKFKNIELRFYIPSINDYRWINVCSIPFFLNNPAKPHKVIVTFEDITHRIAMEKEHLEKIELEKKYMLAKESLMFKQNFLANMSHEMRTPLTGVMGMSDILLELDPTPLQTEYLEIIKNSGEELKEIIDKILDFSKLDTEQVKPNNKVFLFDNLIKKAKTFYESKASPNIAFHIRKDRDIPAKIISDEKRVLQVINNLLSNAIKFTGEGKITLHFDSEKIENTPDEILVTVKVTDTGTGIPKEIRTRIFEPFSNLERNDVRSYDGTGLGLAVGKKISRMLNGDIVLDTQYTHGSRFIFTFRGLLPEKNNA
ncbi:MAG: ATP-binding protein [Bacteroidales bacterium]